MEYDFQRQLRKGEYYEAYLDRLFEPTFEIVKASPEEQRAGIDRHFIHRNSGRCYDVEYKSDETANRTGNAFVETVSVDIAHKLGWAFTSQAEYLLYYIAGPNGALYVIRLARLRRRLPRWLKQYPRRRVPNRGYYTEGLLIPLYEFEKAAEAVI